MHAAPFSKENVPSSCVYSAQGNMVCQKMAGSDPVIPMTPYSCAPSKPAVMERYMDLSYDSMKNKAMNVFGIPKADGYQDAPDFEMMMKQAQDALKTMQMPTQQRKEGYENGEFEKMMAELQKMQGQKEGYMDFNIDQLMQKAKGVVGMAPSKVEKYMDLSMDGMMNKAKGFMGMKTESFHGGACAGGAYASGAGAGGGGASGVKGHSPAETAMNMSYSVSPWPF